MSIIMRHLCLNDYDYYFRLIVIIMIYVFYIFILMLYLILLHCQVMDNGVRKVRKKHFISLPFGVKKIKMIKHR